MYSQEELHVRFYYDPYQDAFIQKNPPMIVPEQKIKNTVFLSMDDKLYPKDKMCRLYVRDLTAKRRGEYNDNNSPAKGISYHKAHESWQLRIAIDGARKTVGYYKSKAGAIRAKELYTGGSDG